MKNIFIVAFLFCSHFATSTENSPCNDKWVPIKMKRFSGITEGSLSKEVQIAKLIRPSADQPSTYEKSFEMGKYRFVRNGDKWNIYRKNNDGKFETKEKWPDPLLIDADQSIYAIIASTGEITIRKNTVGFPKEIKIFFTPEKIYIKDPGSDSVLFEYKNCDVVQNTQNNKATIQTSPAVRTGK